MMSYLLSGKMNNKPLVSIIVTSKNSEEYIEETIASILMQDYVNKEIIFVDCESNDNTNNIILNKMLTVDCKYNHVSEKDLGLYDGVYRGIQRAKGKYLMLCPSSDGLLDSNWISKCVDLLENSQIFSLVWGYPVNKIGEVLSAPLYPWFHRAGPPIGIAGLYYWLFFGTNFPEVNMMTLRSLYLNYFPKLSPEEYLKVDPWLEFNVNFHKTGALGSHINSIANFGRIHEDSLSSIHLNNGFALNHQIRYHNQRLKLLVKVLFSKKKNRYGEYSLTKILSIYKIYGLEMSKIMGVKYLFSPLLNIYLMWQKSVVTLRKVVRSR
jgi:glycosyltransferase involved in cell wall biosynthesis